MNWDDLSVKKQELDKYRPMPPALVENLEKWFLIELTYTSNAIEGNTLTRQETAVVVEQGLTVGGKSLVEHLEATNHAEALQKVLELSQSKTSEFTEHHLLDIHNTILRGIDDKVAGYYRSIPVRISGSQVILPNYRKVPDLMEQFMAELVTASNKHPAELAADAHYDLVTIHPFVDGNGRTARLLMNLILLQHGYPPALIRKRDRLRYLKALEKAQLGGTKETYYNIVKEAVNRSLDIYLNAVNDTWPTSTEPKVAAQLLRIGSLAKQSNQTVPTIRHWTKEGLLQVAETTGSGYQLYSPEMLKRIEQIQKLKAEGKSLSQIKSDLD